MNAREIRRTFLEFFKGQGHTVVPSASLVPHDDPTLFFTNAGMVPFKHCFLGSERRDYTRAATAQKCLRVAGKHNDLEEVGRTPRHHTLFEMLGNFSFGDYFKREAIAFAWELLTRHFGLPADRLVATVYEKDDEAAELWTAHLPSERIFRFGEKDNFWAMGETGPCGPCSELHYDWAPTGQPPTKSDVESGRFWEVWNLVFMQFNRAADGTLMPLAKPSIDTGMGLERLTAILQGVRSNYDTDLFTPLIRTIEQLTQHTYQRSDVAADVSIRVIADHIRATGFLIADGVLPSNEGRGYVLRRIMRRAIRHGKMLGQSAPFFYRVVPTLIEEMGQAYPELVQHRAFIEEVIRNEETRFFATLEQGLAILETAFAELPPTGERVLPGAVVFKLYDTYGFPKDLTEDIAREQHVTVDQAGFETCMAQQRAQARSAWKGSGAQQLSGVYREFQQRGLQTTFTGYADEVGDGVIVALVKAGASVDAASVGETVELLTDRTPFYGEQGGQIGDTGMIFGDSSEAEVTDTQKPIPGLVTHTVTVRRGTLRVGETVRLIVDSERRAQIRKHHTATHLLHKALRETLGEHVKQAGSLVAPDRLRFDFSHFTAVTADQLREIETDVNRVIQQNIAVVTQELPRDEAISRGAMAFFGEKYGDVVRVVEIPGYSMELCGGTHVRATGDIGYCKIIGEGSVAAGVRRLEAWCGRAFQSYLRALETRDAAAALILNVPSDDVVDRINALQHDLKTAQQELQRLRGVQARDRVQHDWLETTNGLPYLIATIESVEPKWLREWADQFLQERPQAIVALGTVYEGKASVVIKVSKSLTSQYSAHALLQPIVERLGGKGGGRPDFAQGGGPNADQLAEALNQLKSAFQ